MLKRFMNDERGQGMTEYILIIALIAVVCIAGVKLFGKQISRMIIDSTDKIRNAAE